MSSPIPPFQLISNFAPAGDQPNIIYQLVTALKNGATALTLIGVTRSDKTFTIANVIAQIQRPTLILATNKNRAAQLYSEMRNFSHITPFNTSFLIKMIINQKPTVPPQIPILPKTPPSMNTLNNCVYLPPNPH